MRLTAQNICLNGNFDNYTTSPYDYAQTCFASGWVSPSGTCFLIPGTGSPDYYNTNGSGGANPPNTWWATVMPHSGGGMEGFVTWYANSTPDYREYISRQLSSSMIPGTQYEISCWVTNGVSSLHDVGTDKLGFYFSNSIPVQNLGDPINVTPQVEMSAIFYSTTWQLITFYYTATAAYDFVTIGNFHDDANTNTTAFGPSGYGCYVFIDDVVIKPATPLPVELVSFNAYKEEKNIIIEWTTATETNNNYFTVLKSVSASNFQSIAQITGAGNSTQTLNYSFTDIKPFEGINYYQLKQTDYNGQNSLSKIIAVNNTSSKINSLLITPNPATEEINIPGNFNIGDKLQVINALGKIIFQKEILQATSSFRLQTSNFPQGIYFVYAINGNIFYSNKFTKQ
jgi:type IX secretion system substrate protein